MKTIATIVLATSISSCEFPVPQPTPTPTPTAAPTATPSPETSPSPTPLPTAFPTPTQAATCSLPPSNGTCEDNPEGGSKFDSLVAQAQEFAAIKFVVNGKVTDESGYTAEAAKFLRSKGLCSVNGLPDEVWVKDSNEFSDHFDIVTSGHDVWRKLAARCKKAKF